MHCVIIVETANDLSTYFKKGIKTIFFKYFTLSFVRVVNFKIVEQIPRVS